LQGCEFVSLVEVVSVLSSRAHISRKLHTAESGLCVTGCSVD